MLLNEGEKILLITRSLFDGDFRRHFVGEVKVAAESVARAEGYVFVHDLNTNRFVRKPERRVRVFSLSDSGNIVMVLPPQVDVSEIYYGTSNERKLILTDGKEFELDMDEYKTT